MTGQLRTIRRSKLTSATEVAALVQSLLVAELLRPSRCLWIVSPWISDIDVVDNSTLGFRDVVEHWGPRQVRLSDALVERARAGAALVVATRCGDDNNTAFVAALRTAFFGAGLDNSGLLSIVDDALLHEKGIAGDDFYLAGSMNLTWTGVHLANEVVTWTREPGEVQSARRSFAERYGGPLGGDAG